MNKVLLAVALVAVLLLPAIVHGPRITPDGVHYLAQADNLIHGRGLTIWDGSHSWCHPPGFGIALAPLRWLGLPRDVAVVVLQAVALLAVFALAYLLMGRALTDWTRWAAAAIVAASPSLAGCGLLVLTEPLFTALALAFVWAATERRIWLAAVLALVLCGVRYHGLAVVVAVALTFPRWRDKLAVALPTAGLMLGGILITGAWRPFVSFNRPWLEVHGPVLNILGLPMDAAQYCGGIVLLCLAVYAVWRLRREPIAAAAVGFYAGLLGSVAAFNYLPMDERIHAPGIVFLLVALLPSLSSQRLEMLGRCRLTDYPTTMPLRRLVMVGLAIACLASWLQIGQATFKPTWRDFGVRPGPRVTEELDKLPPESVYSNAPDWLWFHTGRITNRLPKPGEVTGLSNVARVFFFSVAPWRDDVNDYLSAATLRVTLQGEGTMLAFGEVR